MDNKTEIKSEKKHYDILELQKMEIIELTSIAEEASVSIQNNFKQGLIYGILNNQALHKEKKSELHACDRYEVANGMARLKTLLLVGSALLLLNCCATMKPKSEALRRTTRMVQEEIQYEHCMSSGNDWLRTYRHGWNAPKKMTRIPLTQLYIF